MKKYLNWSAFLFSVSSIAFGLIVIIFGDFHKGLLPVPAFVPGRTLLAYTSGIILVVLGLGSLVKRWFSIASFYLGIVWLVFLVILHLGLLVTDIYNPGEWTATFEVVILSSGSFFLMTIHSSNVAGKLFKISRYALALSLGVFAVLHFMYAEYISTLIPAWIPAKLFLAYFIGVGFMMTAISIVINRLVSLSTGIIGFMFLLWVVILHAPRALAAMNTEPEWTSLFVALASGSTCLMLSYLSKK